ncbi:MAG: FAD:protein FMN transferase [Actinobacteria bacterium]|nr:FAD:protein FMN transferase [Actinomycetota bacterium]
MSLGLAQWVDLGFPAMGTRARLLVLGGPASLAEALRERVLGLEARWTRFRADSELCRLNAAAGAPVVVSSDTYALIELAVDAWQRTGGRFDPTVHDAMMRIGYDRDFDAVRDRTHQERVAYRPAPGCAAIRLDRLVRAVQLPRGVQLDLGGIGKGYTADLVVHEARAAGADGVCVDLGGDVRVAGIGPDGGAWRVDVEGLGASVPIAPLRLAEGGIATSTRSKRTWSDASGPVHHLVDPATGAPVSGGLVAVTVLSGETWWAEVLAKAAFVAGAEHGPSLVIGHGATGLVIRDSGDVQRLAGLDRFLLPDVGSGPDA